MSLTPNFDEDLFISYAHIDNEPLAEGLEGWVETLHERLQIRLSQLTGETVSIWRDLKLQGNDIFSETLITKLAKVAILVAILSPRYIRSEWCLKELNEFCRSAAQSGGLNLGDKSRIFKVVKTYIPLDEHPVQLRNLLGYEFYEYDAARDRAKEFLPDVTSTRDIRYWERLDDLAYDIKQLIETMKEAGPVGGLARNESAATGKVIYLAETTSDLSQQRDLIKRELQQHGHTVLPDKGLPLFAPMLRETVREYLNRSELSIHLLGASYGVIPEDADKSLAHIQSELAEECDTRLRRIVWMPNGLEVRHEAQKRFISHFQFGLNGHKGTEVLQTSLEDLKQLIEERLRPQPAAAGGQATGDAAGPASVYLICDREDMTDISAIEGCIYDRGLDVLLPAFEGDEAQIKEYHKESLMDCDAVLIYYGRANDIWLRMKQRELQKIAGYGRKRPLLGKAIYITGPPTPPKEHIRDREALVIKNYEPFSQGCLEPFLSKVLNAKGALS
ncbi:MAG TPA: TIR domain-containing protein [Pyrinomonadaceae bacterium]|jgi:hypothetical protein